MEIQLRSKRQAQKWLGSNAPTLRMITKQLVMERLARDLRTLKLDKPISGNLIERISASKDLSITEIKNLIVYVILRDSKSREELKEFYLYSVKMISDREKMLSKAGLSGQTTLDLREALPSLLDLLRAGNHVEKELVIQEQDKVPNSDTIALANTPQNEWQQFIKNKFGSLEKSWLPTADNSDDSLGKIVLPPGVIVPFNIEYDTVNSDGCGERLQGPRSDAVRSAGTQLLQPVPDLVSALPIPAQDIKQEGIYANE